MPDSFEELWAKEMAKKRAPLNTAPYTGYKFLIAKDAARLIYEAAIPEGYAVVKIDAGDLVERMQEAVANYLEPTTYTSKTVIEGNNLDTRVEMPSEYQSEAYTRHINQRRDSMFIRDIIYFLDSEEHGTNKPAAISRLSQGGWVKIEDVPQNIECVDVVINQDGLKYLDCTVEDGYWTYSDGHSGCRIENPMFAILALPTPPQEEA